MGEADINRVKLEAEFDGSIVENGVLHSSYLPPPGWDVQPRAQDSEDDMILNALSAVRNSTTVLETAQTLEEDTDFSASPICPAPLCRQFWKAGNYEDAPAAISQVQS